MSGRGYSCMARLFNQYLKTFTHIHTLVQFGDQYLAWGYFSMAR